MLRPRPRLDPRRVRGLSRRETDAVERLLGRLVHVERLPILAAVLFGSKARGDYDGESDVDLLLVCGVPAELREEIAATIYDIAEAAEAETGVAVEPWAVSEEDLAEGARTPMLVDALDDGVPLWPEHLRPLRLPFTPADARFCVACLLDWVREGGPLVRAALEEDRCEEAAARARDDITRLATAALLAEGETRHRRVESLRRFEQRFLRTRAFSPRLLPALAWAAAAYPPDGGRGTEDPPVTAGAAASAELGYELAAVIEASVAPWLLERIPPAG